jgi:hypothetical protein
MSTKVGTEGWKDHCTHSVLRPKRSERQIYNSTLIILCREFVVSNEDLSSVGTAVVAGLMDSEVTKHTLRGKLYFEQLLFQWKHSWTINPGIDESLLV